MQATFVEAESFAASLPDYLTDEEYRALQQVLLKNPMSGVVIPGTGGFRKLRWPDSLRGKGKRGGLRVIYYWLDQDRKIWMFGIYDKDEMADLSKSEKKALKNAIESQLKMTRCL